MARSKKAARIRLIILLGILLAAVVTLIVLIQTGSSRGLGAYNKALDVHERLSSGRVTALVELSNPIDGVVFTGQTETLRRTDRQLGVLMCSESLSERQGALDYACRYYDGTNYYVNDGVGWYIYAGSYYQNSVREDPFLDLGPGIDPEGVEETVQTKLEDGATQLVVTMKEAIDPIPLELPLLEGEEELTLRIETVTIRIGDRGRLEAISYSGIATLSRGDRLDQYSCLMDYAVTQQNDDTISFGMPTPPDLDSLTPTLGEGETEGETEGEPAADGETDAADETAADEAEDAAGETAEDTGEDAAEDTEG